MDRRHLKELFFGAMQDVRECLNDIDHDALWSLVEAIYRVNKRGGTIWTMGNGGSAATASHFAEDLGLAGVDAISLAADAARLTALANDFGYPAIFLKQLEILAKPGDLVFVLSVSGNSANVVEAAKFAKGKGLISGGLLGNAGGKVFRLLQEKVIVLSVDFGTVETIHLFLCHIISRFFLDSRPGSCDNGGRKED